MPRESTLPEPPAIWNISTDSGRHEGSEELRKREDREMRVECTTEQDRLILLGGIGLSVSLWHIFPDISAIPKQSHIEVPQPLFSLRKKGLDCSLFARHY